jgi:hypothetical protein
MLLLSDYKYCINRVSYNTSSMLAAPAECDGIVNMKAFDQLGVHVPHQLHPGFHTTN